MLQYSNSTDHINLDDAVPLYSSTYYETVSEDKASEFNILSKGQVLQATLHTI